MTTISEKMRLFRRFLGIVLVLALFGGCGSKVPHQIVPEYAKRGLRLLAVLPVQTEKGDPAAAGILREELVEGLYFKGYPKIPSKMIDATLAAAGMNGKGSMDPQAFGRLMKVDAVLYTNLREGRLGSGVLFGRTLIDAEFELRSVRTGECLWQARSRNTYHHFGFSRTMVELKAVQIYEAAIREIVDKILSTLPDAGEAAGA